MTDAIVKAPTTAATAAKKSWVSDFMDKVKAETKAAVPSSPKTAVKTVAGVAGEVLEGGVLGGLIGAARGTFGVDAAPAVMAASTLAAVFVAESHPAVAEIASRAAGQAAAIMADRKAEKLLGGGSGSAPSAPSAPPGMKPIGGGRGAAVAGEDPVVAKLKEINARGKR